MRYGAIPENSLEEQLLSAPGGPRALFDTFVPLMRARAIMAAVHFGVFEAMAPKVATSWVARLRSARRRLSSSFVCSWVAAICCPRATVMS